MSWLYMYILSDFVHVYLAFTAQSHCPCSMELYISYFIDPWFGIKTQLLIYSACLLHPTCNYYMHTFIYWSIFTPFYPLFTIIQAFYNFWVVDYASKFQSDMLYLLKHWYFWFLFISTTADILVFGKISRSWVTLLNF